MERTPPRPPSDNGFCNLLSPLTVFFSPSATVKDGPVETTIDDGPTEEALIDSLTRPSDTSDDTEFLSNFEKILDRYGIETVLFLKIHRASRWFKISGKRCSMRSKMGFTGLEFRIRSTAEMKKLRFDWDALNGAEESESSPHFIVPSKFKVAPGESIEKCFLKISTTDKGDFVLALKSHAMRDAALRGLKLVLLNREGPGEYEPTNGSSSSNSSNSSSSSSSTTTTKSNNNNSNNDNNNAILTTNLALSGDDVCSTPVRSEDEGSVRGERDGDADADESDYDEIADDQEVVNLSPNTPKPRSRAFNVWVKP